MPNHCSVHFDSIRTAMVSSDDDDDDEEELDEGDAGMLALLGDDILDEDDDEVAGDFAPPGEEGAQPIPAAKPADSDSDEGVDDNRKPQ